MNSKDLMKMKLETLEEYNRKEFGKIRIPRKQLTAKEKKLKRKMKQSSRKVNRR